MTVVVVTTVIPMSFTMATAMFHMEFLRYFKVVTLAAENSQSGDTHPQLLKGQRHGGGKHHPGEALDHVIGRVEHLAKLNLHQQGIPGDRLQHRNHRIQGLGQGKALEGAGQGGIEGAGGQRFRQR